MPTKNKIVTMAIAEQDLVKIEEYWQSGGFSSRTQGMLDLIRKGLESLGQNPEADEPYIDTKSLMINGIFESLDAEDKANIINYGQFLLSNSKYKK